MYQNIGSKIQAVAVATFVLGAIATIILGFVLLADDATMVFGLLSLFGGPIVAWISSWFMFAFGQLVEDVREIAIRIIHIDKENSRRAEEE